MLSHARQTHLNKVAHHNVQGSDCTARQDLTQHHQVVMGVEHYLQGRDAPLRPD